MTSSIEDVAREAGVSIATVSRVLNNSSHRVKETTRQRVLEACEQLGYAPNLLARAVASGQTMLIGVLIGDAVDPYFHEILSAISQTALEHEYLVLICSTLRKPELEIEYLQFLRRYNTNGVIFIGGGFVDQKHLDTLTAQVQEMRKTGTAFLSLGHQSFDIPEVNIDNVAATHAVMNYLIQLGHHDIAYIHGPLHTTTAQLRLQGYRDALAAHGLPYREDLVIPGDFTYESGEKAAAFILSQRSLPTAVLAFTDALAIGCMKTLQVAGVKIPEDVSVVGFDDINVGQYVGPRLTTVTLPKYDFGRTGVEKLLELMQNSEVADFHEIPHQLVIRESAVPPKKAKRP